MLDVFLGAVVTIAEPSLPPPSEILEFTNDTILPEIWHWMAILASMGIGGALFWAMRGR